MSAFAFAFAFVFAISPFRFCRQ